MKVRLFPVFLVVRVPFTIIWMVTPVMVVPVSLKESVVNASGKGEVKLTGSWLGSYSMEKSWLRVSSFSSPAFTVALTIRLYMSLAGSVISMVKLPLPSAVVVNTLLRLLFREA